MPAARSQLRGRPLLAEGPRAVPSAQLPRRPRRSARPGSGSSSETARPPRGPVGEGQPRCRPASARGAHYLAGDKRTAAAPLPATRCLRAADIERAAAMTLAAAAGGRRRRWAKLPPPRQETRRRAGEKEGAGRVREDRLRRALRPRAALT